MKSTWMVLLDHSESMKDGFSAQQRSAGRIELTDRSSKLEAAKDQLLKEVAGSLDSSRIVIIAFNHTPETIYDGPAGHRDEIKNAIRAISAYGGTRVSLAFDKALEFSKEGRVDCLLISDGLANDREEAIASARKCAEEAMRIDGILIDPSSEGENIIRSLLANGGRYYSVTSTRDLAQHMNSAASNFRAYENATFDERLALDLARMRTYVDTLKEGLRKATGPEGELTRVLNHHAQLLGHQTQLLERLRTDLFALLSALSLGITPSQASLYRLLPVRVYLRDDRRDIVEQVAGAAKAILNALSFELADDLPEERGSWWKKWFFRSRDLLNEREMKERLAKLERAIELKGLHIPQAKVDRDLSASVAELLRAIENQKEAILQVGSILIIKIINTEAPQATSQILVHTLTQSELIKLENNPDLLRNPRHILESLRGHHDLPQLLAVANSDPEDGDAD